jgi:hypothetical protein
MLLKIQLPDNLVVQGLLEQKNIPCFCRVRSSSFEILFQDPFPQATGVVEGWDQRVLDERADAGAGGQYLHYCFGMVTLRKAGEHIFDIVDLSFFKSSIGWCSIVESGKLSPLKQWNSLEDEIEFEASFKNKKLNKKQQETMDALAKAGFVNRPTD